jgi:hypothetical protein
VPIKDKSYGHGLQPTILYLSMDLWQMTMMPLISRARSFWVMGTLQLVGSHE